MTDRFISHSLGKYYNRDKSPSHEFLAKVFESNCRKRCCKDVSSLFKCSDGENFDKG
jgi:hypothetical protein